MDNNVGKDDNDTKSPTGVASFLLNTLRRRIFPSVTHSVNHDDDTADGDKTHAGIVGNHSANADNHDTNDSQITLSFSERLYDLCSRYKFMTKNDTIIEPVLVASGIRQLVESRGKSWDEHRPYLIHQFLTEELRCKCLCEDYQHDDMLHSTCYQEFIGQVLEMYSDLRKDDEFTEDSLLSISKEKELSKLCPPNVKRTTTHSSDEDEMIADDAGDVVHEEFCSSAETDGSEPSFSEPQVEMFAGFDPSQLPCSTLSKDSCRNGTIPTETSNQNKKKKRRKHRNQSCRKRARHSNAVNNEVGSKIVYLPQLSSEVSSLTNDRRCLLDAILSLVPDDESIRNHVKQEFIRTMSSKGDTPISVGIKALSGQQMTLKHVTYLYDQPNKSLVYSLLNIRDQCQLILVIRLWTRKVGPNGENYTDHCVAWDGTIVHDQPRSVRVNNSTDRANEANCRAVFQRLFPTKDYSSWQIIQVFKLEGTTMNNAGKKKEGARKGPVSMRKKRKRNQWRDRHRRFC